MPLSPSGTASKRCIRRNVKSSHCLEYKTVSMPLVRRRKLSLEENNAGNNEGNRSESSNAVSLTPDKATSGSQAQDDQTSGSAGVEKRTSAAKRPRLESSEDGKDSQAPPVPPTPAIRTSTRIIKRKEKDSCQSETPVKKPAKESKTPERKRTKKRQWELWSMEDKDTFFEGLFEYGKDFDAIHNLIVQKNKKKGIPLSLIKNKDQVRFFYYRSIQKLSKIFDFADEAIKKDTMELYALINYGTLRKSVKRFVLNDKMAPKLRELLFQGATTVRLRGKNKRVKTPVCNALKKLNNVDDGGELDPVLIPEKVTLELKPRTNAAWSRVQSTAQNPAVRLKVSSDHSLGSIIAFLSRKWKSVRVRQLEELENVEETEKLTLFCTSELPLHPHVLRPHKQPRINVTFENYRNNVLANLGSPNTGAKKAAEDGVEEVDGDVKPLPKTPVQAAKETPASKHDDACIADLTLLADDNAVFPDNPLTTKSTPPKAGKDGAPLESHETGGPNAPSTRDETGGEGEEGVQQEKLEAEGREIAERVKKPLTAENSDTLTVGQLALMLGLKEVVKFEYEWVEERAEEDGVPLEVRTSKVSRMLQCLADLAALEYREFHQAKAKQKTDKNACLLCGLAPSRNPAGKKDGQSGKGKAKSQHPRMKDAACNTVDLLGLVEPPRLPLPPQPCVVMTKKETGEILATPSPVPVAGTVIGQLPGKVPNTTGDGVFRVPLPAPLVRYKTTTIPTIPSQPNKANFLVPRKRKVKPQRRNGTPMLLPKMTGVPVMMVQTLGGVSSVSEAPVAHTFSPTNLATSQTIAITNLCVGGEAPDSAAAATTAATSALSSMSQQQPLQVSATATFSSETMVSPSVPTTVITSMQPLSIVTSHPIAAAATLSSEPQYVMPSGNLLLSPLPVGLATPTSAGVSAASIAPPSESSLSSNYLGLLDISLPEASNSVDAADKLLGLTGPGFSGLLENKSGNHLEMGLRTPPLPATDESSQMSLDMSPLKQLTLSTDTQWLNKVTKQLSLEISPEKRDPMPVSTPQTDFGPPFSSDSNMYLYLDDFMSMDTFMCQPADERKPSVPSTSTAQTPPFITQCLIPSGDELSLSTLIDSKKEDVSSTKPEIPSSFLLSDDSFSHKLEATTDFLRETLYGGPAKKEPGRVNSSSVSDLLQPPYFSEVSQDAIVNKLDVDSTLQVILNENSLDYINKFEPLTATLEETTENSQSLDTTSRDKT